MHSAKHQKIISKQKTNQDQNYSNLNTIKFYQVLEYNCIIFFLSYFLAELLLFDILL
ncbi:hypothetical protein OTSTA763_0640 [Orientia tsutsugamushi str. TA763]|nr:hypothetical protein OTSTA763_0640 [Orientia tsutsugamushi str. TA763]